MGSSVCGHEDTPSAPHQGARALEAQKTGDARERPVRLGLATVNGDGRCEVGLPLWPFATHWAVQVLDTWFEVAGASKEANETPMAIVVSHGKRSAVGADVWRFGHVGVTRKGDDAIEQFIDEWKGRNPRYGFARDNCQKFAREFIDWLTDNQHRPLPMMDAGLGGNRAHGPAAWSGAEASDHTLVAYAGATVADMQGHQVLLNGELKGPNASAAALLGQHGVGAFSEAELGRTEGGFGPLRAALHLNVNTGVGFRNKGIEAHVLGVGFALGLNGVSLSLPVCTVGLGQR